MRARPCHNELDTYYEHVLANVLQLALYHVHVMSFRNVFRGISKGQRAQEQIATNASSLSDHKEFVPSIRQGYMSE